LAGWQITTNGFLGALIQGAAFLGVAWTMVFTTRLLFVAPSQLYSEAQSRIHTLEGNIADEMANKGRLDFEFIPERRRYEEITRPLNGQRRSLQFSLQNMGNARLTNCKIHLEDVTPNEGNLASEIRLPIKEFDLNPGDKHFVPLASYDEPNDSMPGDTVAVLHVPFKSDGTGVRHIGVEIPYHVALKATAAECPSCSAVFRVWVSTEGRLRMEREL
jgi:hypothetical protein